MNQCKRAPPPTQDDSVIIKHDTQASQTSRLHPVCQPLSAHIDFLPGPARLHQLVLAKEPGQILKGCPRVVSWPFSLTPRTHSAQSGTCIPMFISQRDLLTRKEAKGPQRNLKDDLISWQLMAAQPELNNSLSPLP